MRFPSDFRRAALCLAVGPMTVAAQVRVLCPPDRVRPFFGWSGTDCVNCNIYGSYIEYLAEPQIRDISPSGPGAGKLREHDTLVSVDGAAITTPVAWHRLRDARSGDTLRLGVRREGVVVETSIVPASRCGESNAGSSGMNALTSAFPFQRRDSLTGRPGRRFTLGETTVDIDGPVEAAMYDPKSGDVVLRINGTLVRVHAKVPR